MLIFDSLELVYLAAPKTGSTSFEMAFKPYADERRSDKLPKHARYNRFRKEFPDLDRRYEVITCVRDPLETLHSWYRYRARPSLRRDPRSTGRIGFEEFYAEWCKDDPKAFAGMNSSVNFVLNGRGEQFPKLKVIRYEDTSDLFKHMARRLDIPPEFKRRNVSAVPGEGPVARLKRLFGFTTVAVDAAATQPTLDEVRVRIDLEHPRLREAYEIYHRIRFTAVSDLRSDVVADPRLDRVR